MRDPLHFQRGLSARGDLRRGGLHGVLLCGLRLRERLLRPVAGALPRGRRRPLRCGHLGALLALGGVPFPRLPPRVRSLSEPLFIAHQPLSSRRSVRLRERREHGRPGRVLSPMCSRRRLRRRPGVHARRATRFHRAGVHGAAMRQRGLPRSWARAAWLALGCQWLACALSGCSTTAPPDAPLDGAGIDAPLDGLPDTLDPSCGLPGATGDGRPCACDSDCVVGAVCFAEAESGFPGGVCARRCVSGPCSPGTTCWARRGICTPECHGAGECGPGRSCATFESHCREYCRSDADCLETPCDRHTGTCRVTAPAGLGPLEPCTAHTQCLSGLCAGNCLTMCELDEVEGCPEGTRCLADSDGLGFCAPTCVEGRCPAHLTCSGFAHDGELLCAAP